MGTSAASGAEPDPRAAAAALLAATEGLRTTTRTQTNGAWTPLLGFGLLALAAVPIARYAFNFGSHGRSVESYPAFAYAELTGLCVVHEPGTPCLKGEFDGAVLRFAAWGVWFALLPLAWFVFARWYRLRGEARGIVPRRGIWVRVTFTAATVITAALAALLSGKDQPWEAVLLENGYASPWYLVGIGLLALGVAERSWIAVAAGAAHALLLTGYLGASAGSGWLFWRHSAHPGWADGPQAKALLLAAVLLLAGLGERAAVRRRAASGAAAAGTVVS
ncbi:hypothetical protein [Streptomyces naphthomycinicus]|uniref:hypothetical protein n=1 Tax=Streptomyces naphthomycinicus TaxID=2872625 RepID=UPI001CED28D1|nr:hypothetical protein [Streptomyces sp. TML10]